MLQNLPSQICLPMFEVFRVHMFLRRKFMSRKPAYPGIDQILWIKGTQLTNFHLRVQGTLSVFPSQSEGEFMLLGDSFISLTFCAVLGGQGRAVSNFYPAWLWGGDCHLFFSTCRSLPCMSFPNSASCACNLFFVFQSHVYIHLIVDSFIWNNFNIVQ